MGKLLNCAKAGAAKVLHLPERPDTGSALVAEAGVQVALAFQLWGILTASETDVDREKQIEAGIARLLCSAHAVIVRESGAGWAQFACKDLAPLDYLNPWRTAELAEGSVS